jgi:hypothetical protein
LLVDSAGERNQDELQEDSDDMAASLSEAEFSGAFGRSAGVAQIIGHYGADPIRFLIVIGIRRSRTVSMTYFEATE